MSDHLFVEDIDDAELPGALQRLNNTQLNRTVQGLDSNQIPRVLLAIKSMNDEQGRRIIQRLDPSTDNRIQTFGKPTAVPDHSQFKLFNTINNQEESCSGVRISSQVPESRGIPRSVTRSLIRQVLEGLFVAAAGMITTGSGRPHRSLLLVEAKRRPLVAR